MISRLIAITAAAFILLQVMGCHYYVKMTPDIIISDQPFPLPTPNNIQTPNHNPAQ
jgi:hypothetical protein